MFLCFRFVESREGRRQTPLLVSDLFGVEISWRCGLYLSMAGQGHRGMISPVAPVAYQVILEPGMGHSREFESRRVHSLLA